MRVRNPRVAGPTTARAAALATLVVLLAIMLAGCAAQPKPMIDTWQVPPPAHQPPMPRVVSLLDYAHALAAATPAQREAAVRRDRMRMHAQPDAVHYARMALALGTPGQRLYTPDEAARYARLALSADAQGDSTRWGIPVRQYLSDYARLYSQISDADSLADQPNPDDDPRVRRLQNELAEARRKLHGLAHIEDRLDSVN